MKRRENKLDVDIPAKKHSAVDFIASFAATHDYVGMDSYLNRSNLSEAILAMCLLEACQEWNEKAVEILCQHGANVNCVDQDGNTLLSFATRNGGNESVLISLVSRGLNLAHWRSNGMPLFHWSCTRGFIRLVK